MPLFAVQGEQEISWVMNHMLLHQIERLAAVSRILSTRFDSNWTFFFMATSNSLPGLITTHKASGRVESPAAVLLPRGGAGGPNNTSAVFVGGF